MTRVGSFVVASIANVKVWPSCGHIDQRFIAFGPHIPQLRHRIQRRAHCRERQVENGSATIVGNGIRDAVAAPLAPTL